jgi:hypothetical protein
MKPSVDETFGEAIGDSIEEALEADRGGSDREPIRLETKELAIPGGH